MKKIAILSFYSGIVERGVENFTYELAKRLSPKYSVTIYCAGSMPPEKFKVKTYKSKALIPQQTKGLFSKLYLDLQSYKILFFSLKIAPSIISGKYDLVIPASGGWQTVIFRIITKFTGAKLLVTGQAGIGADDAWNLFFRPDVFVALTKAQYIWAKRLTHEVKTYLIPNGVDLSIFNPKVKKKQLNLKKPIVVCAAALTPYKRVDLSIKAVAKAGDMSLLVLGNGQLKGNIDSLGKRLLGDRYRRLVVPYREIASYYRSANVFTLASETEAFGISYLEAMACNLPVVTTADSSREEIIGEAGILTDPEHIEKYAKDLTIAVKTNYKNKPYAQSLKFSWNKVAANYSDLIGELLKK